MDDLAARAAAEGVVALAGLRLWQARVAELGAMAGRSDRVARAVAQRHPAEVALERLRRGASAGAAERRVARLAAEAVSVARGLQAEGRARLRAALRAALAGEGTLGAFLHVFGTAMGHRAQGYQVAYAGFAEGAAHDLVIRSGAAEAEVACGRASAEEGRDVHRGAWMRLVEALDPDLQTWLAAHPGRYLLKLTLPQGLRAEEATLAQLQARIRALLAERRRADQDEAAILRLDPLVLAAAQHEPASLMTSLRREFGPEAHLAVMRAGGAVCVLAARAGREDEVAGALRRRMAEIAPIRFTGTRPGILAMLVEDTDAAEWRQLRDRLELEGAARQFLTEPAARHVVAVTCVSREELFEAEAEEAGLRFRNPMHPAARLPALAAAVLSTA